MAMREQRRLMTLWLLSALTGMLGTFVFVQLERNTTLIYTLLAQGGCVGDAGAEYLSARLVGALRVSATYACF